jgi:hypothetical protein
MACSPGCYTCLINLLGPCDAPPLKYDVPHSPSDADKIEAGISWTRRPPNTDAKLTDWVTARESLCLKFLSDLKIWAKARTRMTRCGKWADRGRTVEISEHERLEYPG